MNRETAIRILNITQKIVTILLVVFAVVWFGSRAKLMAYEEFGFELTPDIIEPKAAIESRKPKNNPMPTADSEGSVDSTTDQLRAKLKLLRPQLYADQSMDYPDTWSDENYICYRALNAKYYCMLRPEVAAEIFNNEV